jgi:hypothetical protein
VTQWTTEIKPDDGKYDLSPREDMEMEDGLGAPCEARLTRVNGSADEGVIEHPLLLPTGELRGCAVTVDRCRAGRAAPGRIAADTRLPEFWAEGHDLESILMASWQLRVFGRTSDDFLYELPVPGLDSVEVRDLWGLPGDAPIGALPITEKELAFLNRRLDQAFVLGDDEEAFLELVRDFAGETLTEADGTIWYPPP